MSPLQRVGLTRLMSRGQGRPEISVALIDGPVAIDHPELSKATIREVSAAVRGSCSRRESLACEHGTFVAGMLAARREADAPAICPACTLILRPIFAEGANGDGRMPSATPGELALAVKDAIVAGANVINLSAAIAGPSSRGERALEDAFDYACRQGVLVVAAAGNQGIIGSSPITRHPWVITVIGCDLDGRPTAESNLGCSIGKWGLSAPGQSITSLGMNGQSRTSSGTSVAAPFVTGALALLWSEFPDASAVRLKLAVTRVGMRSRRTIVPPLLDAWSAFAAMARD
jgi:subtilisin family serine protease